MYSNVSAVQRDSYILQLIGYNFWLTTGVIFTVEIVLTAVINSVAIYLITQHKVLYRSPTNIFMLSACCADFFYELTILANILGPVFAMSSPSAQPPWWATRVCLVMFSISMAVSLVNTCCISVERGIATFRPLNYKSWVTTQRAIVVVVLTWTYMLILQSLLAFIHFRKAPDYVRYTIVPTLQEIFGAKIYETYISTSLYVPLSVSIMVYSAIAVKIFYQSKNIAQSNMSSSQRKSLKVTKVSMQLLLLMMATMLPSSICNLFLPIPSDPSEDPYTYRVNKMSFHSSGIIMFSYSFLNIIFYGYNHKDFRAVVVSKLRRNKVAGVSGEGSTEQERDRARSVNSTVRTATA